MNVQLSGHHVEVTPAIRDYLTEKLSRVKRHFDQAIEVHAVFSVERSFQKAALRLHAKGHDFQAEDVENDLYAAIDLVVDKLDKQVVKYKNKNQEHHSAVKRQVIE
jgi:putative sigma-54 modulation protein